MRPELFSRLAPLVLLVGCQAIAGLDSPQLAHDAAALDGGHDHGDAAQPADGGATDFDASAEVVEKCSTFCDDVETVCNGKDGPQAYPRPEACRAVCQRYDFSTVDPTGPTFACRRARADSVLPLVGSQAEAKAVDSYCTMLGVGGEDNSRVVGEASCGSNCENYCQLRDELCGLNGLAMEDCVTQCGSLVDTGPVNASADFEMHPDSVQCRLAHLAMAATPNGMVHCDHSRINPIRTPDPDTKKPTGLTCDLADDVGRGDFCDNYCHLVMSVCDDPNESVWASEAECLRVCKNEQSLPMGELSDHDENSWSCRRTHTYIALEEPAPRGVAKSHCSHASIGGGGNHCGTNACAVYCDLAQRTCDAAFALAFPLGLDNCVEKCGDLQGVQQAGVNAKYTTALGEAGGNTYACRLHAIIGVLNGDALACPAALGAAAPCVD